MPCTEVQVEMNAFNEHIRWNLNFRSRYWCANKWLSEMFSISDHSRENEYRICRGDTLYLWIAVNVPRFVEHKTDGDAFISHWTLLDWQQRYEVNVAARIGRFAFSAGLRISVFLLWFWQKSTNKYTNFQIWNNSQIEQNTMQTIVGRSSEMNK